MAEDKELIEEEDVEVVDTGPNELLWERLPEEPNNWYSRFLLFRDLGPTRTLTGSLRAEQDQKGVPQEQRSRYVGGAWRQAAEKYQWKERAEAWDEYRRRVTFNDGYASDLTRITKLDELAQKLEEKITMMLEKMGGPKKFSPFLVERYLQTLDAIAKETGGRKSNIDLTAQVTASQRVVFFVPESGAPNEDIELAMPLPVEANSTPGS